MAIVLRQNQFYSIGPWSPVLQVWIQLLLYIQKTTFFASLVKSSLVKLETSCTVILPPKGACSLVGSSLKMSRMIAALRLKRAKQKIPPSTEIKGKDINRILSATLNLGPSYSGG